MSRKEIDRGGRRLRHASRKKLSAVGHMNLKQPNAKANIVVFHGFRGHMGSMTRLITKLYDKGYNVFALDFPNHGRSVEGENERGFVHFGECMTAARAAITTIRLSEYRKNLPIFIVGYSLGALVAYRLLQEKKSVRRHVSGVVCISTPLRVDQNVHEWIRKIPWVHRMLPVLKKWFPRLPVDKSFFSRTSREDIRFSERELNDPFYYTGSLNLHTAAEVQEAANAAHKSVGELADIPMLFIHGTQDKIAHYGAVKEYFETIGSPHWSLRTYPEGFHDLLSDKTVPLCGDILNWIDTVLSAERHRKHQKSP